MVCNKCLSYENGRCRLHPVAIEFPILGVGSRFHWCGQGKWEEIIERNRFVTMTNGKEQLVKVRERVIRHWGEWENDTKDM